MVSNHVVSHCSEAFEIRVPRTLTKLPGRSLRSISEGQASSVDFLQGMPCGEVHEWLQDQLLCFIGRCRLKAVIDYKSSSVSGTWEGLER